MCYHVCSRDIHAGILALPYHTESRDIFSNKYCVHGSEGNTSLRTPKALLVCGGMETPASDVFLSFFLNYMDANRDFFPPFAFIKAISGVFT